MEFPAVARALSCTAVTLAMFAPALAAQQPTYTTFEGFTTNASVNGQGGWSATNPGWDEEVVDDGSGNLVWRVSNAVTSGSFGDQPIAPGSDLYAGESSSMHLADAAAPVTNRFYASFDLTSVTGASQPGLDVTVSPDDGMGSRQSFLSIEDNGTGLDIVFFESQGNHPVTNPNGGFVSSVIASGLSYADTHTIAFDITFVDGNVIDGGGNVFGNDIVRILVDGQLVHTGTTWESYYWTTTEGQTPPSVRAVDTLMFRLSTPGSAALLGGGYYIDNVFISTVCPNDFQGFETDIDGWDVFSSMNFFPTRVASGTNGVPSASGSWHAVGSVTSSQVPAGNWGGYAGHCDCASISCATGPFPTHGYTTSVEVYLDLAAAVASDTRFDYSSAINRPNGNHRRDFIFNVGYYDAGDATSPGAGADRYIVSASNNSGQPPFNPPALPVAVTATGWYTFEHRFYRTGLNVLACEMTLLDPSGAVAGQWTRSDPTDIIDVTVGGNRYAWFPINAFPNLAFDNAARSTGGEGALALTIADCQDDFDPGTPGYQIAVQVEMQDLTSFATGFQAFVDYDMGTFTYEGALSSYTATPFPQHIQSLVQPDDGRVELDGSDAFGGGGTDQDSVLATLVFTVHSMAACMPPSALTFETGGSFPSELSFNGVPLATALIDPAPYTLDDTPPVLDPCPANIVQAADADSAGGCGGAFVSFTEPTAMDNCDPAPVVVCSPASGSFFPVGVTPVTCTATDACGNVSSCMFTVEVTSTNLVDVVIELVGVTTPTTRCIRFVADACSTATDISLNFDSSGLFSGEIELPCGSWTSLCVKDEQHTKWDTVALNLSGTKYVAAATVMLEGGDTDNDGDVDINDVTLFISQFGQLASAGGCPWDGITRDADFSNNGAVGAEDYSFLTANWLTTSGCACVALPLGGGPSALQTRLQATAQNAVVDLDGNGWIDWRDVHLFELRHGFDGSLSRAMRATTR